MMCLIGRCGGLSLPECRKKRSGTDFAKSGERSRPVRNHRSRPPWWWLLPRRIHTFLLVVAVLVLLRGQARARVAVELEAVALPGDDVDGRVVLAARRGWCRTRTPGQHAALVAHRGAHVGARRRGAGRTVDAVEGEQKAALEATV